MNFYFCVLIWTALCTINGKEKKSIFILNLSIKTADFPCTTSTNNLLSEMTVLGACS